MRRCKEAMANTRVQDSPKAAVMFAILISNTSGTWVPLHDGRNLAERNGVLEKLQAIFDYVPGERSPPPATKHATAASNKPKAPRQTAQQRKLPGKNTFCGQKKPGKSSLTANTVPQHSRSRMSDVSYDTYSNQLNDDETPDNGTLASESEEEMIRNSQYSRKRKRGLEQPQRMSREEQQHLMWSDELLDYFMLQNSNEPIPAPPEPPPTVSVDRSVDDKGHTPMHWATAMGDMGVIRDLIQRGARIDSFSNGGETPLMRAVIFTNNYEKQCMDQIIHVLHPSVGQKDWFGSTVFHHLAFMTCQKSKYQVARYYLDTILTKLGELYQPQQISQVLDLQDQNGDTAVLIAARNGARKCVRAFLGSGAGVDLPNNRGETADELIKELNARRRDRARQGSSSPIPHANGTSNHHRSSSGTNYGISSHHKVPHYRSEAATLLSSQLPTLITSRAEALAAALEAELAERELEAREGERLLEQRRQEIDVLRKQSMALAAMDADDEYDEQQRRELNDLIRESKALVEIEQTEELRKLLGHAASNLPVTEGGISTDDDTEKLRLAREIATQQTARTALVADVVVAQSLAGVGERQEVYKRLITGALGVKAEDVEALLPDMIAELEAAKGDAAGDVDGDVSVVGVGVAPVARMGMDMHRRNSGMMLVGGGGGETVRVMG